MGGIEIRMTERIITLTTDFGLKDPYLGAMKGAILSVNPAARIVDITHMITPGDIREGALVLKDSYSYFPPGTIHVGVVDPGVGGARRPLLIETERFLFVGPDNGLFSPALEREKVLRVIQLTDKRFFSKTVSPTFHGRDIFGPVAAHLSLGADPSGFGVSVEGIERIEGLAGPEQKREEGSVAGSVIYVDSYGNLITDIEEGDIESLRSSPVEVVIKGRSLDGIVETYSEVEEEALAALIGSSGRLEVAVNLGSAQKLLGAGVGERVVVRVKNR